MLIYIAKIQALLNGHATVYMNIMLIVYMRVICTEGTLVYVYVNVYVE